VVTGATNRGEVKIGPQLASWNASNALDIDNAIERHDFPLMHSLRLNAEAGGDTAEHAALSTQLIHSCGGARQSVQRLFPLHFQAYLGVRRHIRHRN
jgi:hypothetical protein